MAITVAIVPRFSRLNDDRSLAVQPNGASRERFAVVDITYAAGDNYVTSGNIVDFSGLRGFKTVYAVEFLHISKGLIPTFVPGANDGAALGRVKLFGVDPADAGGAITNLPELPSASTATNNLVIRCIIRGN